MVENIFAFDPPKVSKSSFSFKFSGIAKGKRQGQRLTLLRNKAGAGATEQQQCPGLAGLKMIASCDISDMSRNVTYQKIVESEKWIIESHRI